MKPFPSTDQEPCFEVFPFFKLRPFDGHHFWLENYEGEGMAISKQEFLGVLLKLWEKY